MRVWVYRLLAVVLSVAPLKLLAIEAYVQPCVFYKDFQPYLDIQIFIHPKGMTPHFSGDSLQWLEAKITFILKQNDSIIGVDKLLIKSPKSKQLRPFFHAVKWEIKPGVYQLETHLQDGFNQNEELTLIDTVKVLNKSKSWAISDAHLLQFAKPSADSTNPLYRNGFYGEPLLYETFEQDQHLMLVYFESYSIPNLEKGLAIRYLLSELDTLNQWQLIQKWFRKRKTEFVEAHLLQHDISELPTGKYSLAIQIINQQENVLDETVVTFFRKNPFWDRISYWYSSRKEDKWFFDTLSIDRVNYCIRAIHPLISGINVPILNELLKDRKEHEKRLFLFSYFSERADTARRAYERYMKLADFLDAEFKSGFGYGFETDRGIIFLRYGKPDEVIKEDKDPGAYPYEIWKYNKVAQAGQTNVRFLFYNPDLAGSDFRLLHSTAIGERQNRKWEIELYKNAAHEFKGDNPIDATEMLPNINRRAREYFEN